MKKAIQSTLLTGRRMLIFSICGILLVLISSSVLSNIAGTTGQTSTNGRCSCHSNQANTRTIITITSSTGGFSFTTGQVVQFNVTISDTTSTMIGAGCNFGVKTAMTGNTNAGILDTIAGSGLHVASSEITQSGIIPMTGGTTTFSFQWTAPSTPGTYYLRGIGMTCNGDSLATGDHWNRIIPQALTVNAAGVVFTQSDNNVSVISTGLGVTVDRTITFTNIGSISGIISQINIDPSNSDFSIVQPTSLPDTVNPNSTLSVVVRYNPTTMGPTTGTLHLTVDGQTTTLDVALTGQVIIQAHSLSDTTLTFSTDSIGKSVEHQFIITNNGTGDLLVTRLRIQTGITDFTIIQPNPVPSTFTPDTLKPDSSLTVIIRFTPTSTAQVNSYLTVGYSGIAKRDTVYLHGSVTTNGFVISKSSLTYVSDSIGKPYEQTVIFTNKSTSDMSISSFNIIGKTTAFSVVQPSVLPVIVHPDASLNIIVRFTAVSAQPDTANLKINVDGISSPGNVALYGTVYRFGYTLSNKSLYLVTDSIGKTVDQQFLITNNGTDNLLVTRLRIQTGITVFTIVQPTPAPSTTAPDTLKPDSSLTVIIRFTPTATTPVNSFMTIGYAGQMNRDTVTLHGQVTNFAYVISDTALNFVTDGIGKFHEQKITIKNTCLSDISLTGFNLNMSDSVFLVTQPLVLPVIINPDSSLDIYIRYTPNSLLPVNTVLNITVDGQTNTIDIQLNGKVNVLAYTTSDTSLYFESSGIGISVARILKLRNQGTTDFSVTNINVIGSLNPVFSINQPTTFPVLIKPDSSLDIKVLFTPIVLDPDNATLKINIEGQVNTIDIPMSAIVTISDVPEKVSNNLFSIYPNPAESDFNLEFNLTESQQCNLVVFDLNGIEIKNLNFTGNSGINKLSWISSGATKLNSGVYFILLNTQTNIQFRRMIVIL